MKTDANMCKRLSQSVKQTMFTPTRNNTVIIIKMVDSEDVLFLIPANYDKVSKPIFEELLFETPWLYKGIFFLFIKF